MVLADEMAAVQWAGGFEPFGEDWQAGTMSAASANGMHLRLPGQWVDELWENAASAAGVYQNVNRWYEAGTGRYSRVDPLYLVPPSMGGDPFGYGGQEYGYSNSRPLFFVDPLGLEVQICGRPVDLPYIGALGIPHKWVKTDKKEAGLGPLGGGIPGQIEPACDNSCPYIAQTSINDHSGESQGRNASCVTVENVDEDCVNRRLTLGQPRGRWWFGGNDCWAFARDVINQCRKDRHIDPLRLKMGGL